MQQVVKDSIVGKIIYIIEYFIYLVFFVFNAIEDSFENLIGVNVSNKSQLRFFDQI